MYRARAMKRGQIALTQAVLESLEQRQLLSASLQEGILTVAGTEEGDYISVAVNRKDRSQYVVNLNGKKTTFARNDVKQVRLLGGMGDDLTVVNNLQGAVAPAPEILTGPGEDLVIQRERQVRTKPTKPKPVARPAAPTGLTATIGSGPRIDLSWVDTATSEQGFIVERSEDGAQFIELARLGANVTAYRDGGVEALKTYRYRLKAYNAAGQSQAAELSVAVRPTVANIIGWYTIGGATTDASTRRMRREVLEKGWGQFVSTVVESELNLGIRRLLLHNPFGTLPDEPMQFDQYIHAQEAGLSTVVSGFAEAWKPIVERGIEVIAYIGSPRQDLYSKTGLPWDPDFVGLTVDSEAWWQRVESSLQPLLDARASIALDASSMTSATDGTYLVAQYLRERGVKVYVEHRPFSATPHWCSFPWIADYQQYQDVPPSYMADLSVLSGEAVQFVLRPRENESWADPVWFKPAIQTVLLRGQTVAVAPSRLLDTRLTVQELLAVDAGQ